MRDPNRLDDFYEQIKDIHKNNFPDLRIGQFFMNFFSWYTNTYWNDFFYTEDKYLIEAFKEYINEVSE